MNPVPAAEAHTTTLENYFNGFGYDRWKYCPKDEYNGDQIMDKLVCVDPDKGAVLEVTRRRGPGTSTAPDYIFERSIRTVNRRVFIGKVEGKEYFAMEQRFFNECPRSENTHYDMRKELGL